MLQDIHLHNDVSFMKWFTGFVTTDMCIYKTIKQWWSYDPRVCDSWWYGTKPSHSILMVLWHYISLKHHWVQSIKKNLIICSHLLQIDYRSIHRPQIQNARQTNHRQEESCVPWGVMASASSTIRQAHIDSAYIRHVCWHTQTLDTIRLVSWG